MSKYEVVKKIMESNKIDENKKLYYIQSYLLNWLTEENLKWLWQYEENVEEVKASFSNEVLDVQDYVEIITGDRPDYTTLDEMEKDFEEKEICLWNYPICEADFIVEEGFNVSLVRFTKLDGGYEYRWCEME